MEKEITPDFEQIILQEAIKLIKDNPSMEFPQALSISALKHGFKLGYSDICDLMEYAD